MSLDQFGIKTVEQLMRGIGVAALPGEVLTVAPGDTVRVSLTVDYRGPAYPVGAEVRVAFGKSNLYFDEVFYVQEPVQFFEAYDFLPHPMFFDLLVPARPYEGYDLYATIRGVPGPDIFTPYLYGILNVLPAYEFRDFVITGYDKV